MSKLVNCGFKLGASVRQVLIKYDWPAANLGNEIRFFTIHVTVGRTYIYMFRIFGCACWVLFKQELQLPPDDAWHYYAYLLLLCLLNNIVCPVYSAPAPPSTTHIEFGAKSYYTRPPRWVVLVGLMEAWPQPFTTLFGIGGSYDYYYYCYLLPIVRPASWNWTPLPPVYPWCPG